MSVESSLEVSTKQDPGPSASDSSRGPRFSSSSRRYLERLGPVVVIFLLCVYFTYESAAFLTVGNLQEMAREASELLLVALGGTLVVLVGSIDLSVGSMVSLVGLGVAYFSAGPSWWLLVLLALGMGLAAGLFNGFVFTFGRVPSFLVTLGTLYLFPGVAQESFGAIPLSVRSNSLVSGIARNVLGIPVAFIIAVAALLIVTLLVHGTVFGRNVFAAGGNERVARLSGINVRGTKIVCFAISGVLCGIAALLLCVRIGSSTGDMGADLLLPSIAAVVIGGTPLSGGVGGPVRTVLGVVLLEVLVDGMNILNISPFAEQIVEGLVVIVAVVLAVNRGKGSEGVIVK